MELLKKEWGKSALIILAYIAFVVIVWYFISSLLGDKETIREIIKGYGLFAPIIFIIIQITQNIIAPISHYPLLIAGGYIFGPINGFLLNWIGTTIGTFLIIILAKKFGRPLVNKMVSKKAIDKYDHIVKKISPFGLFLIYALPIFPDDEISYLIGISAMPLKSMIFPIVLGKIGGATNAFIGDSPATGFLASAIIGIIILIIGTLYYQRKNIIKIIKKHYKSFYPKT